MVRLLYRLLRAFNFVGSVNENQRRSAMRSSSLLKDLIVADLDKPLSYALPLTGNAMSPLLNTDVNDMRTSNDRLIIRRLSGSTQSFLNRVYVDDVVVILDPNDTRRKYVRKIAAMEGAHMQSMHGDPPFNIPKSHCWVERENKQVDAPDSSSFGPLSLQNVIGRVMYAIRSATDHGRVKNSPYAMASDSIVLAHENISKHFSSPPSQSQSGTQDKSN
ncbi:unnamed protein product [Agarophyton chilense]